MKSSKDLYKFGGFSTDDFDFISYINNTQVDYCVLLKRKDKQFGDLLENFEVVNNFFAISTVGRTQVRDVITKQKYLFCNIELDGGKKFLKNRKQSITTVDYICVTFRELYFKEFLISLDPSISDMRTIYSLWNQRLVGNMLSTVSEENKKARTRK